MKTVTDTLICFLIAATMQNLVLTTGIGTSAMLKIIRRPRQLLEYGKLLLLFTVAVTTLFYPIDQLLPASWLARMIRPLIIILVTCLLYALLTPLLARLLPEWFRKIRHLLPLAAFNNLVVGVTLVINHQVKLSFFPAVGLAAGSAVGFILLSLITAEGISRLDNPDIPDSFRGLPATLLYLGLLALALMGFSPLFQLT